MPLTPFQRELLQLLAGHRNPESYVAGAIVIHRNDQSARFSHDVDIFHDLVESVRQSAAADGTFLQRSGYKVDWIAQQETFCRARIARGADEVSLDWSFDSAFRFFPVERDPLLGYRLHVADAAVNKVLALAGRREPRDYVDALALDRDYLSIAALCWAACGKDPGFTPELVLDEMDRNSHYRPEEFEGLQLRQPLDLVELKQRWIAARDVARNLVLRLPAEHLGCLYLDSTGKPTTPNPDDPTFRSLTIHHGSVRGAWPTIR